MAVSPERSELNAVAKGGKGFGTTMMKATTTMKKSKIDSKEGEGKESPSQLIEARIAALGDWRSATLARVRALIKQADPGVVERTACFRDGHRLYI
jgi:hypothetical protein